MNVRRICENVHFDRNNRQPSIKSSLWTFSELDFFFQIYKQKLYIFLFYALSTVHYRTEDTCQWSYSANNLSNLSQQADFSFYFKGFFSFVTQTAVNQNTEEPSF